MVASALALAALALRPAPIRHPRLHMVATSEAVSSPSAAAASAAAAAGPELALLERIDAPAPALTAFDLAEAMATRSLAVTPWKHAFRKLVTDEAFLSHGWARRPFKLNAECGFAVGSYTMRDVERDITQLPPQFVAHGMQWGNGIYNKPMDAGFSYSDVAKTMEQATVVMLNAGFIVPALAQVSLAMLEATQLPIWTNVYLSRKGLTRSTQLHTDQQDVFLVQTTGRKRWRVYAPPAPAETPAHDPFARGKGEDQMATDDGALLIDTVMEPGQLLYIPAGFPHATDTMVDAAAAAGREEGEAGQAQAQEEEPSVHLTVGVDTHLWSLSYAHLRAHALRRAGESAELADGRPVTALPAERWAALHEPLPLGFLSAPILAPLLAEGGAATGGADAAEAAACRAMAERAAATMLLAEPMRWQGKDAAALREHLKLDEAAARMVEHHRHVLAVQTRMYLRAAHRPSAGGAGGAGAALGAKEQKAATAALMQDMDELDAAMAALDAWSAGAAADGGAAKAGFGGGGGGGGAGSTASKKKGAAKKKKR